MNILKADSCLDHQYHDMICKICYLIDSFFFVLCLAGNDYLGAFLSDLFEYLVKPLFNEL